MGKVAKAMAAVLALVLAGCTSGGGERSGAPRGGGAGALGTVVLASALQPFDGCDDLLRYFTDAAADMVGPWGLGGSAGGDMVVMETAAAAAEDTAGGGEGDAAVPAPAQARAADEGATVSGTNVQEAGVDEPDIVKTDGRRMIAVAQGRLQVLDLTGGTPRLTATLQLPPGWGHELLLDGDTALVLAHSDSAQTPGARPLPAPDPATDMMFPAPSSPLSVLSMIDLSDPAAPQEIATLQLDGDYRSARMVDGVARVVVRSWPTGLPFVFPEGGGLRAERDATERNREIVANSTIDNWLPYYVLTDRRFGQEATSEGTLLDCEQVTHPQEFSGLGMLSVLTVDLGGTLEPTGSTGIVADGDTVYASPENLYVATSRWLPQLIDPLADIAPAADDVTTELHAFDITDPAATRYRASGEVSGHLLNQWSLSEHAGNLRVATTTNNSGQPGAVSESAVAVLAERDGELVEVGRVGGLGRTEQIYAVRFLGDIAAVVKFRQTDPLYLLDLADPTTPRVLGELKIPGYSAYLHPVGDGRLLGVGQDADDQGRVLGSQVSLFDITDLANPTQLAQLKFGDGSSEVEYDHRAFLYWAETGLAVMPLQTWAYDEATGTEDVFTGALGVQVDSQAGALREAGRLTHGPDEQPPGQFDYRAQIRRALVVGGTLYTVSELGVETSALDTLADTGWVAFSAR